MSEAAFWIILSGILLMVAVFLLSEYVRMDEEDDERR